MDIKKASFKIGDIVYCRAPDALSALPVGLPTNARAKLLATYIRTTYVLFEGKEYSVPSACVHSGSDDYGTLAPTVTPTDRHSSAS